VRLIGLDLCWIHLRSEKRLRIKDAGILGKGLFADNGTNLRSLVFNIGDNIIENDGEPLNAAQKMQRYGNRTSPYLVGFDEDTFYDCAVHRCAAGLINHICHSQANVRFSTNHHNSGVRIRAIKRIYNGTQLRVSYNSELGNAAYIMNENNVRISTNNRRYHA
jgi:SET domain